MPTETSHALSTGSFGRMTDSWLQLCFVLTAGLILSVSGCNSDSPESANNVPPTVAEIPADYLIDGPNLSHRQLNAEAADSSGQVRFEILEDSGIDFTNVLQRKNFKKLIETGSGVALGDYDSDGQVDVYLVSTDGPNRMYRGLGDFKFADVTDQLKVDGSIDGQDAWGSGASFADIDNDGDLDLFVCNMSARNLLYVNQGDGTFIEKAEAAGVAYNGASKIGTFCDYDRDGDLDLYLLTYQDEEPTDQGKITIADGELVVAEGYEEVYGLVDGHMIAAGERDILYENDGDGNFTNVSARAGIEGYDMGLSATWFDFDNDDWIDLYVANDFQGPDKLYRNNGDGTFRDVIGEVTNHTPWFSMGSAAGDINNDGLEDIMVGDMSGTSHYKQKVNMGNMSDLNWFLIYGHPRQYMRNALFINTGTGRFLETAFMSDVESTDWTWAVKLVDLDNDGLQDVFVTNGNARNTMDSDIANQAREKKQNSLSPAEIEEFLQNQPPINESNIAFQNKGNLQFESVGESWNLNLTGVSHGAAFGDFDRDGDLDLVVNNLNEPATLYRNCSAGGNRLLVELRGNENNYFGFGSKVEIWSGDHYQQRRLVPVSGYLSSDEPVLHFGVRDWSTVDRLVVTWANGKKQEFRNLQVNRLYRITEDDSSDTLADDSPPDKPEFREVGEGLGLAFREPEEGYDDYQREPLLPFQLSQLGPGAAWGDVNQDGFPDLFVGGSSVRIGKLYVNVEGKKFIEQNGPWENDFLNEDMGALFFDANGDGFDDLYVVSGSNEFPVDTDYYLDRVYLNDGQGNFSPAEAGVLPDLKDSGSSVAAADFDRDGDLDLFVGSRSIPGKYPLSPSSRLLRNDNGKFTDVTTEVSESLVNAGLVNSALWSDFDGDGWTDLLLAIEWGPVRVFQNQEGKLIDVTNQLGLQKQLGWWHGLAAGDFDNDGDLDYVATNHGLNSKYHCSPAKPHRLYYHDFDENGTIDLVETEFEGDEEFPMRGRSCSSHCMPFIAEKFETFHEFALADIYDIYEVDTIEAPHLAVNELRSSILWNDGEQGFTMEPLPRLAQISPAFGAGVADFDNDGDLDILLSQNFFGAQPETGYMDGGVSLLLRGDGSRNFDAVWPNKSGIVVPDDALTTALSDFDQDGDIDALFVTNRGPVRLFENNGADAQPVSLILVGSESNRHAIGAQVQLKSDDLERVFEIGGTSGYLGNSFLNVTIPSSFASALTEVTVRWPDGSSSTFQPKVENGKIILQKNESQVSALDQ